MALAPGKYVADGSFITLMSCDEEEDESSPDRHTQAKRQQGSFTL